MSLRILRGILFLVSGIYFIHIGSGLSLKTGNYPLVLQILLYFFLSDDYLTITFEYSLILVYVKIKISSNVLILTYM